MQDQYNQELIKGLYRRLNEIERSEKQEKIVPFKELSPFEEWVEQLDNELSRSTEETEEKEQYLPLTKRDLDNMMIDPEEAEKEYL